MVRLAHRYSAPAERVFDAWLTPSQASRFLFATRTGNVMQCEINPVVGGGFVVTDRRPLADGEESVFDAVHRGNYVTIDKPRLLVFNFVVASYADDTTQVTLEFSAQGANGCEITLTHELGDSEEALAMQAVTRKGWAQMLATLERELFPKRVGFF